MLKKVNIFEDIFLGEVFFVQNLLLIIWHIGMVQKIYQMLSIIFHNFFVVGIKKQKQNKKIPNLSQKNNDKNGSLLA